VAGRQAASTRPITLRSRVSASRPRWPPTSARVARRARSVSGLKLHDRIATGTRQALHGAGQQPPQAVGEEGAAEELHRVAVLLRPLVPVDLPQIGGELGLLVLATGDVLMRGHHLPPRLQTRDRADGSPAPCGAAPLVADLLLETNPQQLLLNPAYSRRSGEKVGASADLQ